LPFVAFWRLLQVADQEDWVNLTLNKFVVRAYDAEASVAHCISNDFAAGDNFVDGLFDAIKNILF
jgi:hypothetical protein